MELVPAGVPLSFEVTFDANDLPVAMSVYDDSGVAPVLLLSPFAMALVAGNTYRGKFTAENGKAYIVIKAVYTDGTFATLDPNYAQGSESMVAQYLTPAAQSIVGLVGCSEEEFEQQPFNIFRGDVKTMYLKAVNAGCDEGPLDLTHCTEIDVALPNADGTFSHLLLSAGKVVVPAPAILGKFNAPISSIVSAPLNPGEFQTFNVTLTILGAKVTVPFRRALSVFE
jgi:hypothetical protein